MKNKKLTRTCIGCKGKRDKRELIRIVKNKHDEVLIDFKQNIHRQRGIYL